MATSRRRTPPIVASSLLFAAGLTLVRGFCFAPALGGAICDSNTTSRCRGATADERQATQQVHSYRSSRPVLPVFVTAARVEPALQTCLLMYLCCYCLQRPTTGFMFTRVVGTDTAVF